jgi:hypothetical protein
MSVKAFLQSILKLGRKAGRKSLVSKLQAGTGALDFPNSSRSYDVTRQAVRFWGNDSAMEASFYISNEALNRIRRGATVDQADALRVFDNNRPLIYAAAAKVYARGHKGSYELVGSDF